MNKKKVFSFDSTFLLKNQSKSNFFLWLFLYFVRKKEEKCNKKFIN